MILLLMLLTVLLLRLLTAPLLVLLSALLLEKSNEDNRCESYNPRG